MLHARCLALLLLAGSAALATPGSGADAPYPPSLLISAVSWDFSTLTPLRKAHGSDLWPLTWARDGSLYGAWGDGGGFDGDDDHTGRVSLGFARIDGRPAAGRTASYSGKNLWGDAPLYAERQAQFGGKVGTLLSVGGVLYGHGGLWLRRSGVYRGDDGETHTLVWSSDLGLEWRVAPWTSTMDLGSFLNFGRDYAGALDRYVYMYYERRGDGTRVYLKRVPIEKLTSDPDVPGYYQYFTHAGPGDGESHWSTAESRAAAIYYDPNHALGPEVVYDRGLRRFLLTVGHSPSGEDRDASAGQVGLFEGPHPWGPWSTVGYYDDWGRFGPNSLGDYLGLHLPTKWMSRDGTALWAVFSSMHQLDSFNVVRLKLSVDPGETTRGDSRAARSPSASSRRTTPR